MRIRTLLIGITAFVVLLVSVAAIADTTTASPATTPAVASASTDTAPAPAAASDASRYEVHVTPEMTRHSHIEYALYFVSTVYSLLVLLFLLATGISARMRDLATRIVRRPFLTAMVYFVFFTLVSAIIEFPLDYYSGFVVPHQFDLTTQTFGDWLIDALKGLGVSLVIGSILSALALLVIRRVRRWWLVLWAGFLPLAIFLIVIQPIVLDPIFNKFVPLKDPVLRQALLDEASTAGIQGSRVFQVDKSKQTKTMNAYVNGIGPSKRIVLWDTLIAKMNKDEILAVMGHEMGHYVLDHIWKGLAFALAVAFVLLFVGQKIIERGATRFGPRWGFTTPGDPAALPWILLVTSILGFILSPINSGFSRHVEHQADIFSLEMTHLNGPMATAFIKLAEDSKQEPRPPRFIELWMFSHPSLGRRIDFVLQYKPWEKGQPNELWHPK